MASGKQSHGVSRRGFLAAGVAGGAALTLPARPAAARPPERATAANLIFMVADGMSAGTLALGDLLHRRLHGRPSRWIELLANERVIRSFVDTRSADSIVTDSAASATAWSIGSLVNNGAINVTPDGDARSPILLRAREGGRATGLVTTTRVTHATPAAFIANNPSRNNEDDIAAQILDRRPDLVLGGGARYFSTLPLDGPSVLRTRAELLAHAPREPDRILGLFANSHLSYAVERPEHEPSLEEMTRYALRALSPRKGGFVLQIEGGRVDHAAHNNDPAGLLFDQLAFDRAVAAAAEFALGRDDTLLIVTTDHGTANPALTDYTGAGEAGFERIHGFKHSFEWIEAVVKQSPDRGPEFMARTVEQATGIIIRPEESQLLARWVAGEPVDPYTLANAKFGPLGSVIANHTAIAFLSPNHTCDFVELTALGPGADRLRPYTAIHEIHEVLTAALDLAPARNI